MPGSKYPFHAATEDAFVARLNHFNVAAAGYSGLLAALTPAAIAGTVAFADFLNGIRANVLAATEYAKGLTATKRALFSGSSGGPAAQFPAAPVLAALPAIVAGQLAMLGALLAQLDADPAMSDTIRADLGMLRPATPAGAPDMGPVLELLRALAEQVSIKWNKAGHTGTVFQSRLAGSLAWVDLGTDLYSPFVDKRPLAVAGKPETREYRACYLDKDSPSEVWSDVLVVTVTV